MFKARTFIVAIEAMKKHQDYLGVQIGGCKLLVLLAAFESHRATLVEQDIILPIFRALIEFKDSAELQINGLNALAVLAGTLENKLQKSKLGSFSDDRSNNFGWTMSCALSIETLLSNDRQQDPIDHYEIKFQARCFG